MLNRFHNFATESILSVVILFFYLSNVCMISSLWMLNKVPDTEADMKGGKTIGYIYIGEELTGSFSLLDGCRHGVAQTLKELKSLGITTAMLTGDNRDAAMSIQQQVKYLN